MLMNIVEPTKIWPAIYWYIGMALQLYLIFLLLRRLSVPMLIATGIAACLALSLTSGETQSYLRHNFIGWMPEFIFGMVCFRIPYKFPDNVCAALLGMLICAALVFAASLSPYTYYLGGLMFVAALISIRPLLVKIPGLRWLGAISASIYVIHPLVRYVTFQQWPSGQEMLPGRTALLVLALSIFLAIPYQKVWTALLKKSPSQIKIS